MGVMAEGEGIEPSSVRRRSFRDCLLTLSATLLVFWRRVSGSNTRETRGLGYGLASRRITALPTLLFRGYY